MDFPFIDFTDEQLATIEVVARMLAIAGGIGMLVITAYRRFLKAQ